ncbi:hypothetical protein WJX82_007595 [Trebouxia sp. C0006]
MPDMRRELGPICVAVLYLAVVCATKAESDSCAFTADGEATSSLDLGVRQTCSETAAKTVRPPIPDLTTPIHDLYNATRFIRTSESREASPTPSCCNALRGAASRSLQQSDSAGCPLQSSLKGNSQTGHWGYWYDLLEPAMVVVNDSVIDVEMPTFESGSAWSLMGAGDPGMEDIYHWDADGPRIAFKGPDGTRRGHYMTGPIYVCGAQPGDVIEVQILDLVPRPNPQGESFGTTTAYAIGWWNRVGYSTPDYLPTRNAAVVYKAINDPATGRAAYWEPQYMYDSSSFLINKTTTGCVPESGAMPRTTAAGAAMYHNPDYTFGGVHVPCINNTQNWTGSGYGGFVYDAPEEIRDYSVKGKYRIPMNMHIGNMGLAPAVGAAVTTGPPFRTGGNLDNKRIGIGATMFYPVEVAGGLLSMGDCHGSQSDGETAATGIETSLNGKFRIILHKADALPKKLQLIDYPMLENANEIILHGFAYKDFLREIPNPQVNVHKYGPEGGVDLIRAMSTIYNETRAFLIHNHDITEDVAINIMSLGVDFQITQVVDANVGIHSVIPKWIFNSSAWEKQAYYQDAVKAGTSRTSYP